MSDFISRQDAINELKKIMFTHLFENGEYIGEDTREVSIMNAEKALDVIENIPSAELERTAKVRDKKDDPMVDELHHGRCMNCGKQVRRKDNYCSRCGSKLEWE